ncbi:MAG: winged helix DNA-binding protein [Firmicutes bacterium]|nr:winged helix DNA-binding protein [Bacillota bacterium]
MANYTREISHMLDRLYTKVLSQDKNGYYRKTMKTKLNLAEMLLLRHVGIEGEVKLNHLIKVLEVDRNFVTTTVNRLVGMKVLTKRPDTSDGRSQMVSMTPSGRELYLALAEEQRKELAFILDDVTINEEKTILKFISKIVQFHTEKYEIK